MKLFKKGAGWVRITAIAVIFFFLHEQIVLSYPLPLGQESSAGNPSAGIEEIQELPEKPQAGFSALEETQDFLSSTLTLESADVSYERGETAETSSKEENLRHYFDYALEELNQGLAAAVIVDRLDARDIQSLLSLRHEVGIAVIGKEIVLFTSGDQTEIRLLEPSLALLKQASFIAHTHTADDAQDGPSLYDLQNAVPAPQEEYVLTRKGAFAYNRSGVSRESGPLSIDAFLFRLLDAKEKAPQGDETAARSGLNEFIFQMDRFNHSEETKTAFRRSEETGVSADEAHFIDPSGSAEGEGLNVLEESRDELGRVIMRRTPDHIFEYSYDEAGKISSMTQKKVVTEERGLENLALGKKATSSSYYLANTMAKHAVDGKRSTVHGWVSGNTDTREAWLQVDLGQEKEIAKINVDVRYHINWGGGRRLTHFVVWGSLDGKKWTEIVRAENIPWPGSSGIAEFEFEPSKYRYLKVTDIHSRDKSNASYDEEFLSEIEVFEKRETILHVTPEKRFDYEYDAAGKISKVRSYAFEGQWVEGTNAALGKPASATTTNHTNQAAAKAVDGVFNHKDKHGWVGSSADGRTDSLRIDFGSVMTAGRILYDTRYANYGTGIWQENFTISGSIDGINWFPLVQQTGLTKSSAKLHEFNIAPTDVRYVKVHDIYSRNSSSPTWHRAYVTEIQVFETLLEYSALAEKIYAYEYGTAGELVSVSSIFASEENSGKINFALGGAASASSYYDSNRTPAKAVDGKDASSPSWVGKPLDGSADWLRIDLGSEKEIGRLVYDNRYTKANTYTWQEAFSIWGSLDGDTWFLLAQKDGLTRNSPKLHEIDIEPKMLRYLKVDGIKSHNSTIPDWHRAYVTELEAYEWLPRGPEVSLISSPLIKDPSGLLYYLVDGIVKTRTLSEAPQTGGNRYLFRFADAEGRETYHFQNITYQPEAAHEKVLADQTRLFYESGNLVKEITPANETLLYSKGNGISSFQYGSGAKIVYGAAPESGVLLYDSAGTLLETLTNPAASALDESKAIRLSLENGLNAYYVEGEPVEFRTVSGVRITDFSFAADGSIEKALVTYPDGTVEVIRNKVLLRRSRPGGVIEDFTPAGALVREIFPQKEIYYEYEKTSQTGFAGILAHLSGGGWIRYDAKGLLSEAVESGGKAAFYETELQAGVYVSRLDTARSSPPDANSAVEAHYSEAGVIQFAKLQSGTQLYFENGTLKEARDKTGAPVQYDYEIENGLAGGLKVSRNGAEFLYDKTGFLSEIKTASGTIRREASESGASALAGDELVDIILEENGGNKLSDFELDADGKIVKGIIETKEGVKQFIQNGIMTGFQTADGRVYNYSGNQAVLKEWLFQDGTKAVYGGGTVQEIVYPDQSRLNNLGRDAEGKIISYRREKEDGTVEVYEDGRLTLVETPDDHKVLYGTDGRVEKITLADGKTFNVSYRKYENGITEAISLQSAGSNYLFDTAGNLISMNTGGVSAEVEDGQIKKLFTRFGFINDPQFGSAGLMSGEILYADGIRYQLSGGFLKQVTLPSGTKLLYQDGKIHEMLSEGDYYRIDYGIDSQNRLSSAQLYHQGNGGSSSRPLIPYLLANPDSELARFFLANPLYNALDDHTKLQTQFDTGNSLFFAKFMEDAERERAYEFGSDYFPFWDSLALNVSSYNSGFISLNQVIDSWDSLPANLSDFIDINGDGLSDRVLVNNPGDNFWWVQINDGQGFQDPMRWQGVNPDFRGGALTYYEGRHPHVLGTLIDINGDKRPDRVMQEPDGASDWYIQLNNGEGFDPVQLWNGTVHVLSQSSPQASYASQVRDDQGGGKNVQELISDLIDMDGDGLPDRLIRSNVPPFGHWFFQRNTGDGFEDAEIWEGVASDFSADPMIGSSLSWYQYAANGKTVSEWIFNNRRDDLLNMINSYFTAFNPQSFEAMAALGEFYTRNLDSRIATYSELIDMNNDGRPDRLLVKDDGTSSKRTWYVQWNNGGGFDAPIVWDTDLRSVPGALNENYGTAIRSFQSWEMPRNILMDVVDVTGDGLPDRITLSQDTMQTQSSWWVEVNNGSSFDPAVEWTGIYGGNNQETAIGQDDTVFRSWGSLRSPGIVKKYAELKDMNGDKIADRIVFSQSQNKWFVQFGTGSGFMPVQEMEIESLTAPVSRVSSSSYDYLHVSIKAGADIPASGGKVRIMLGEPENTEVYQEWTVDNIGTNWKDFYLPINAEKANASQVRIIFEPSPTAPEVPLYVDNITFTKLRPDASKDWLDRLLTNENVLSEINSNQTQTLSGLLNLETEGGAALDWDKLFSTETVLNFNSEGEVTRFQNLYGTVTAVENGRIAQTTLADGTVIAFSEPSSENPNVTTQTVTDENGASQQTLTYGRVRSVTRPEKSALQYSYEFSAAGDEITVVYDPDTKITERYGKLTCLPSAPGCAAVHANIDRLLLSRSQTSGVDTQYFYDASGTMTSSQTVYKGRVRQRFQYEAAANGNSILVTENGTREEYSPSGEILYHTTPEGFRYKHSTAKAKKIVTSYQTESVTLADGEVITFEVPSVTEAEDPLGEEVRTTELESFTAKDGSFSEYEEGFLKSVRIPAAQGGETLISFDRAETIQTIDEASGKPVYKIKLKDVTVLHGDGTVTEYRDGVPYAVVNAAGRTVSLERDGAQFKDRDESSVFHYEQALKTWNDLILKKWEDFQLPPVLAVSSDYDKDGKLLVRRFAEGSVQIYENGNISEVLAADGERLIDYTYDAEGNLLRIHMEGSRRRLETSVLKLKAEVETQRAKSLRDVAEREQVLNQTLEGEHKVIREKLLDILGRLESHRQQVGSIKVKGKFARRKIGEAIATIDFHIDDVNEALAKAARQHAEALEKLKQQVAEVSEDIESQSNEAFQKIETEKLTAQNQILKQEFVPVINHWYREVLGRDASRADYEERIAELDFDNPELNAAALKAELEASEEFASRTTEVRAIKSKVASKLRSFVKMSQAKKLTFAAGLNIQPSELVSLTSEEVEKVLAYLMKQSLHFGQSAYLALEAMLESAGLTKTVCHGPGTAGLSCESSLADPAGQYSRVNIAVRMILTDILTGTLTPVEEGDLVLSLYAMRRVAAKYGVTGESWKITYQALKEMYDAECPDLADCDFRLTAHIDGNHFIIITRVTDTEVSYIDPGAGPENALEQMTVARDEFMEKWGVESVIANDGTFSPTETFGYIFSPRAPPEEVIDTQARALTLEEEMAVRGAFFGLEWIIIGIINAIIAVVSAVVSAIVTMISTIMAGISSILSGFGAVLTGNFAAGFSSIIGGFKTILSSVFVGFKAGVTAAAKAFATGKLALVSGIKTLTAGELLQGALISFGVSAAFEGTGMLLEAAGVSPKITRSITSIGKVILGAGLLAAGNLAPLALGFIGGGASEFLSLHTSLSPAITGIIGIGASAIGAFSFGFPDITGNILTGLEALKAASPYLLQDLAAAGISGLGSALSLDPRITALLQVPVAASAKGLGIGINNSQGIFDSIKDSLFSGQTLGGLVSIGASIGLEALDAPSIFQNFIPSILGQMAAGASGSVGDGGGSGDTAIGKGILSKIGEGLKKFGGSLVNAVGSVVSFGQKIIEGIGNITVQGFKKAVKAFSSIFSRQTQEKIYADETNLRQATVTQNGSVWTWQSGDSRIDYNTDTGEAAESFGIGGTANITGLSQDEGGNFYYQKLDYQSAVDGGAVLRETYENGRLSEWGYYYGDEAVVKAESIDQGWQTRDDWIRNSDIEILTTPIEIPGTSVDPNPSSTFNNFVFKFNIVNGQIAKADVEAVQVSPGQPQSDLRLDKNLYVATNGIGYDPDDVSSNYMENLRMDLFGQSSPKIDPIKDVIVAPTFALNEFIKNALNAIFGAAQTTQIIQKIKNVWDWYQTQKQGGNTSSVFDLRKSIKSLADIQGIEAYARGIVGVGYSGGFASIVHALTNGEFISKAFVALGGATAAVGAKLAELLVNVVESFEQFVTLRDDGVRALTKTAVELLSVFLKGPLGVAADAADLLIDKVNAWYNLTDKEALDAKVAEFYESLQLIIAPNLGYTWNNLANSNANAVVNIYGSKDPLTIGNLIGGHLDELGGYSTNDDLRPLFNIEIMGANHYDYINGVYDYTDSKDITRNEIVSQFVAQVILNSDTAEKLQTFLASFDLGAIITPIGPRSYRVDFGF